MEKGVGDVKVRISTSYGRRKNASLGGDDHRELVLLVELVDESLDGISDLVHHNLLLLSHFLLFLSGVVVEVVLLLLEFLAPLLSDRTDQETLVEVGLEFVGVTLEFVDPAVDLLDCSITSPVVAFFPLPFEVSCAIPNAATATRAMMLRISGVCFILSIL